MYLLATQRAYNRADDDSPGVRSVLSVGLGPDIGQGDRVNVNDRDIRGGFASGRLLGQSERKRDLFQDPAPGWRLHDYTLPLAVIHDVAKGESRLIVGVAGSESHRRNSLTHVDDWVRRSSELHRIAPDLSSSRSEFQTCALFDEFESKSRVA